MPIDAHRLKIKLQVMCGEEIAMGPGKADLLDAISREGSISGAGRAMGMSYRRAWLLVDAMNRCWAEPLVHAAPGRSGSGGARLTAMGADVLARYRALQAAAEGACAGNWAALDGLLLAVPRAMKGAKGE
ncbi:MAG: LysR family transcriptional regulator [Sphingomonadales bacterium]|nr:LysR family transcriptional regulator [Sphingomonadales bacterium]